MLWGGGAPLEEISLVGGLRLGTDDTTITKGDADVIDFLPGSECLPEIGFPKIRDESCIWVYSYDQGISLQGIVEGAIVNNLRNPTRALTRFVFNERFDKLQMDTLRVEIRHWIKEV